VTGSTTISRGQRTPLWLNSGSPSNRTHRQQIRATLLGRGEGHIRCPRVYRLALWFGRLDPIDVMEKLLRRSRFSSPEELRQVFAIPGGRLIATPLPDCMAGLEVQIAPPRQVLEQALMLGLCTQHMYDPGRPVLWTRASLLRGLELFDPTGFYAWRPSASSTSSAS
jgi:hypothetical protein